MEIIASSKYNRHSDPGIACTLEEKVTKQSFTEDCDINKIIERIAKTGVMPEQKQKKYGDFSSVPDYQSAFNIVQSAQEQFNSLDPKVRMKFNNSPEAFLEHATDPKNIDSMIEMGLATKNQTEAVKSDSQAKETQSNVESAK